MIVYIRGRRTVVYECGSSTEKAYTYIYYSMEGHLSLSLEISQQDNDALALFSVQSRFIQIMQQPAEGTRIAGIVERRNNSAADHVGQEVLLPLERKDEGSVVDRQGFRFMKFSFIVILLAALTLHSSTRSVSAPRLVSSTPASTAPSAKIEPTKDPIKSTENTTPPDSNSVFVVPNVLLAGVQKGGTSAVADWLFNTHKVCQARVFEGEPEFYKKEVHFFDKTSRYEQGLDFYSMRFQHCKEQLLETEKTNTLPKLVMDATPNYQGFSPRIQTFYSELKKNNATIPGSASHLKVMMILREPTSRLLSFYNHMKHNYFYHPTPPEWTNWIVNPSNQSQIYSFEEYLDNVRIPRHMSKPTSIENRGFYINSIKEWLEWIPRDRFLLLSYSELIEDPGTFKERIANFLELPLLSREEKLPESNAKKDPSKVKQMSCRAQQKLRQYFDPKNNELYDFLEANPGPPMEQRPFPKFEMDDCLDDSIEF